LKISALKVSPGQLTRAKSAETVCFGYFGLGLPVINGQTKTMA